MIVRSSIDTISNGAKPILLKQYLNMNEGKTEFHTVGPNRTSLTNFKKLGSKFIPAEALSYRIQQALAASQQMLQLWKKENDISIDAKLRLYNAYIETILAYNLCACPLTKTQMEHLDATHRKQLKYILNIHYPQHISNVRLYEMTKTERISTLLHKWRWTLFRHILNLPENIPAYKIMLLYFSLHEKHNVVKNSTRTSLLHLLQDDLKRCRSTHHTHLETTQNLIRLRLLNKENWAKLVDDILREIRQEWKVKDEEHEAQKAVLAADAGKDPAALTRKARKNNETGKKGTKSRRRPKKKKHIEVEAPEQRLIKRSRKKKKEKLNSTTPPFHVAIPKHKTNPKKYKQPSLAKCSVEEVVLHNCNAKQTARAKAPRNAPSGLRDFN